MSLLACHLFEKIYDHVRKCIAAHRTRQYFLKQMYALAKELGRLFSVVEIFSSGEEEWVRSCIPISQLYAGAEVTTKKLEFLGIGLSPKGFQAGRQAEISSLPLIEISADRPYKGPGIPISY
ncbi:MAG: hypothetical protein Q9190_003899 [Brigantiaea leucoxantha]